MANAHPSVLYRPGRPFELGVPVYRLSPLALVLLCACPSKPAPAPADKSDGGLPSCATGTHSCEGRCLSDDSPASCGDRCSRCPSVENAEATCQQGLCGTQCAEGFSACLGQCLPASDGPCGLELPANAWKKLTDSDTGPRTSAALAYLASTGEYLLVGGAISRTGSRPYDVQALKLPELKWRNQFPVEGEGDWGPGLGAATAPAFASEKFETKDVAGNLRPSFHVYPGIPSYYQFAHDAHSDRLYFYLFNRTFSYDLLGRKWTFHQPPEDPAGGPDKPRLLWGSMAADPSGKKLLLFGGGNVQNAQGAPGSWVYEVETDSWRTVVGPSPSVRALSPLSVDPDRRKALLFGGDELDVLKSDTWVFDFASEKWTELHPARSPSPRFGHQLLFLPESRATVLFGGQTYTSTTDYVGAQYQPLPLELWQFDWTQSQWRLVSLPTAAAADGGVPSIRNLSFAAAAGAGDVVVVHFNAGSVSESKGQTWALRVDPRATPPSLLPDGGVLDAGVETGAVVERTGPYHPSFYAQAPAPDAGGTQAFIEQLPENAWTELPVPNRPTVNLDWGTVAIAPQLGKLFRWSGGHSAYSGTNVFEYDMGNNRYSIGYPAELPLDFVYSNDQTPGQWTFKHRPFMTGHTYRTYAYSQALQKVVMVKNPHTYYFDPATHDFEPDTGVTDIGGTMYTDVLVEVPAGMMAWTPTGLWQLEPASKTWTKQTVTGTPLPAMSPDRNVAVYDGTKNRLLLLSSQTERGQVWAYDLATHVLSKLNPDGRGTLANWSTGFYREAVHVPGQDVLLVGTSADTGDGTFRVPVLHLAENRWYAYAFGTGNPQSAFFGVSLGLGYDPVRDRIWAVNTRSQLWLLKLNALTASKTALP